MEDENNVASAEVNASEPLSFDSALSILNQADEAPVEETPAATETPEGGETVEEADQAEPSSDEQETEAAPEASTEDPEFLHGNARTRLRDGSEVTIGELKKAYDEAKEYRVKQAEFDAKRQEFEAKQAQIAAQEQHFTQTINQARAILQANFPPKPDFAALERGELDIITYNEQKARYDNAVEKWHGLNRAEQQKAQESQQRQAAERQQYLARETERLIERVPEFKDPAARQAFAQEAAKVGAEAYGMPAGVIENLGETWAVLALKDAIAYRKLQADKAKVAAKVKDVPPVQVQAPGRRVSPAEKQAATVKNSFDRLRKTGSFDDALAILNSME